MADQIIKEKIRQAAGILKEKNIDMWMTFVRESSIAHDPALDMILGINLTWESAIIINKDGSTKVIVGSLEVENINRLGLYNDVSGYVQSIREDLVNYIKSKNPNKIAINYSKDSVLADGLTYGLYQNLLEHFKGTGFENKLVSAEEIISALKGRKSPAEIKIMEEAIEETLKIIDDVTKFLKPGVSELDIANFVKEKTSKKGYGLAWDEDHCPAVFSGPEAGDPHSGPTERKVEKGHLVNIDFGIKYKGYCSDLQRTWYILKDNEKSAPPDVVKGFNIIRDSIQKVFDNLKPGVKGCDMDDIARNYITEKGYPEYPHGLGHQVGREVHDGGGGLFPRWERYGDSPFLPIEEGQVYTIEPRLPVEGFGTSTLEEEVFVTKTGARFMSKPQKELMLVRF
jgi:Xaa-Pro aminopeptidase